MVDFLLHGLHQLAVALDLFRGVAQPLGNAQRHGQQQLGGGVGVVLAELFQRRTGQDGAGDIGGGGARGQPGLAVDQAHFANQAAGAEHADRDRVVAAHHDVFHRHLAF